VTTVRDDEIARQETEIQSYADDLAVMTIRAEKAEAAAEAAIAQLARIRATGVIA